MLMFTPVLGLTHIAALLVVNMSVAACSLKTALGLVPMPILLVVPILISALI